jgi:nicotinamidase-related amidase
MRIIREHTVSLAVDIQEKLIPFIFEHEELLHNMIILIRGLKILEIPLIVTEQYPKGLGETVPVIREEIEPFHPIEKTAFSCCDDPRFMVHLNNIAKKYVIVFGIEAHVCILQTTIDLIEDGFQPVVIEDCISSRKLSDKMTALERMRQEGAIISSYESILFELARISGTDQFREISRLVK